MSFLAAGTKYAHATNGMSDQTSASASPYNFQKATYTPPFDTAAAQRYAELAVKARAAGRGFPTPDGYIAAIAAAHAFAVATRDTTAFLAAGLRVIDPWTSVPG